MNTMNIASLRRTALCLCLFLTTALPGAATSPEEFRSLLAQAGGGAQAAEAQLQVARCYEKGDGVEKDPVRAAAWYSQAASYGSEEALLCLQKRLRDKNGNKLARKFPLPRQESAGLCPKTTELVNTLTTCRDELARTGSSAKKAPKLPLKDINALLRDGANPNLSVAPGSGRGATAMDLAAEIGNLKLNELLVSYGGTFMLNWRNPLLNVMYRMGVAERQLRAAGAHAETKRAAELCLRRELATLRYMLQGEYDARMLDTNGSTLLWRAAQMESAQSITALATAGADVNQPNVPQEACDAGSQRIDRLERTPLFAAIEMGSAECVSALVRLGADVHYADKQGTTPLDWAQQCLERSRSANVPDETRQKAIRKHERCLNALQAAPASSAGNKIR